MFKSKSISIHLVRGLGGFGLLATALSGRLPLWVEILLGVGGVFLLRGCPLCWAIGLIETVLNKIGAPNPRGLACSLPARPSRPAPPNRD
jgi:hypothetical protein